MCGIGGVYNPKNSEINFSILKKMLEVNKRRGVYSFGFAFATSYYKTENVEEGVKLFSSYLDHFEEYKYVYSICFQFRTPTVKVKSFITDENPPFILHKENKVSWVWVANTTSNSSWWQKERVKSKVNNDAWYLGYLLIKTIENKQQIFKHYNGPFAIILYNEKDFYVAVSGYPLYFYFENDVYYFSSVKLDENWKQIPQNKIFKIENGLIEIGKIENEDVPWLF